MTELKITKEAVLKASEKCGDAKAVLKELFPEVFEDNKYFDLSKLVCGSKIFSREDAKAAGFSGEHFMKVRSEPGSEYANSGFYLSDEYSWELKRDRMGVLMLIPTKK